MFKLISVTNRKLCRGNFLRRIEEIASSGIDSIILREKDLSESEYSALAEKVLDICNAYNTNCILHKFYNFTLNLKHYQIHLPLYILKENPNLKKQFKIIGVSVHSLEEGFEAVKLGADYVTFGHIFITDCKKGLTPRGVTQLQEICSALPIPVYAIGGIDSENINDVKKAGASGACIMSGLMECEDVNLYTRKVLEKLVLL